MSAADWAMGFEHSRNCSAHELSGTVKSSGWPRITELRCRANRIVSNSLFDCVISFMIFANAIEIGLETDYMARNMLQYQAIYFRVADLIFYGIFTCELAMRIFIHGRNFFRVFGWAWNIFDTILIILQSIEEIVHLLQLPSHALLRMVAVLRVVRVIRIFRIITLFHHFQLLISSLIRSLNLFVWAFALISVITYIVSIYVTHAVFLHRANADDADNCCEELIQWYGNLPLTMMSLFQSLTGGVDWNDLIRPIMFQVSPYFGVFLILLFAYVYLAVMNFLTASCVGTELQHDSMPGTIMPAWSELV